MLEGMVDVVWFVGVVLVGLVVLVLEVDVLVGFEVDVVLVVV
ncbi:hypothetical protein A2U01_0097410, partial [Trifolium medium]|nr:hypothetical protein [Trifolium medium]